LNKKSKFIAKFALDENAQKLFCTINFKNRPFQFRKGAKFVLNFCNKCFNSYIIDVNENDIDIRVTFFIIRGQNFDLDSIPKDWCLPCKKVERCYNNENIKNMHKAIQELNSLDKDIADTIKGISTYKPVGIDVKSINTDLIYLKQLDKNIKAVIITAFTQTFTVILVFFIHNQISHSVKMGILENALPLALPMLQPAII